MALQGDLSTLDLTDLLQNIEMHARDGCLEVASAQGGCHLYFKQGRLALFSADDHPSLMDVLVAAGAIRAEDLARVRKKRRGSGKALGEIIEEKGLLAHEELVAIASARLLENACELIGGVSGAFTFREGGIPRGVFDPEERRLDLALQIGPLLLEAARRTDHLSVLRERIPLLSAHYVLARSPNVSSCSDPDLAAAVLERVDPSRSVREILAAFPYRRFEALQLLGDWVGSRCIHVASAREIAEIARDAASDDPERARAIILRGLIAYPHSKELLEQRAELARSCEDREDASEALKLLLHLQMEAGAWDEARVVLESAKELDPQDSALWERSFDLAMEEKRADDAQQDGRRLAELYREQGLPRKACAVYERLLEMDPDSANDLYQLARAMTECGQAEDAVQLLLRFAKARTALEDYAGSRAAYVEILAIDPVHEGATAMVRQIDDGALAKRRAERRAAVRRFLVCMVILAFGIWLYFESLAKQEMYEAERLIAQLELVELRQYDEVIGILEFARKRYPFSTSALFDLPQRIAILEQSRARASEPVTETEPAR